MSRAPTFNAAPNAKSELDTDKSSYAGYLFGSAGTAERPAWSDTTSGRLKIRLISRGVVGSAFFVAGTQIAARQMSGYESFKKFSELDPRKPLQYVARFWDVTVGKPLEFLAYHLTSTRGLTREAALNKKAKAAWEITNFRTKLYNVPVGQPNSTLQKIGGREYHRYLNGRGLGSEIVAVTFDFFMASIGDAATRNIFQSFDPNIKQPWLLDENGHATTRDRGRYDAKKSLQAFGRSTWRIFSKNAMEDWAAALPYVYQMKWQRQALAKWWPGAKITSDQNSSGAVALVRTSGPDAGKIVGGYQSEGALDLQLRFMGYNWYTLMYREMYDMLGRNLQRWKQNDYHIAMPDMHDPLTSAADAVGYTARYITKSLIKSALYMAPSVVPFWLFRVPQSKYKGALLSEELATAHGVSRESALITKHEHALATSGSDPVFLENIGLDKIWRARGVHGPERPTHAYFGHGHEPLDLRHIPEHPYLFTGAGKRTLFDHMLNPFGAISYHTGTGATRIVDKIFPNPGKITQYFSNQPAGLSQKEMLWEREKLWREGVNAGYSYYFYMGGKTEAALRVDDRRSADELGLMDKAIYRLEDYLSTGQFRAAGRTVGEIIVLGSHIEKEVKGREGAIVKSVSVGDGTIIPRADNVPTTAIHTANLTRSKGTIASKYTANAPRQWTKELAMQKREALQMPASATVH